MAMKNSDVAEPKVCESCGESFGCGAKIKACWCFEFELSSAAARELKETYVDCLCPKCLLDVATKSETN